MKFDIWRILSIVLIFFLILTVWYLYEANESVNRNNAILSGEKKSIEKKLTNLYSEKKSLESEIENLNKEKSILSEKMSDYENRTADYEKRLEAIAIEMDKLKQDTVAMDEALTGKNSEIESLKKKIADYESDIAELNKKLSMAPAASAVKKSEGPVNLEPITVMSKGRKDDGKVLEVNKQYEFIVVNIGAKQGVKVDDILFIFRNKALIGKVMVEKVGEDACVAKILYKSLGDVVMKGDIVSY